MFEDDLIVILIGIVIGIATAMLMYNVLVSKVYVSGKYITYKDKVYKEVPEEELDNLVILEVNND